METLLPAGKGVFLCLKLERKMVQEWNGIFNLTT